jgi:hypothetical protein
LPQTQSQVEKIPAFKTSNPRIGFIAIPLTASDPFATCDSIFTTSLCESVCSVIHQTDSIVIHMTQIMKCTKVEQSEMRPIPQIRVMGSSPDDETNRHQLHQFPGVDRR